MSLEASSGAQNKSFQSPNTQNGHHAKKLMFGVVGQQCCILLHGPYIVEMERCYTDVSPMNETT